MKILYGAFAAVLVVVAVVFALSNRQAVDFGFWPLPYVAAIPVYAFGLGVFAAGFLCGGFFVWLRAVGARGRARIATRRADRLQQEVTSLQQRLDATEKDAEQKAAVVAISNEPLPKIASVR